MHPGRSSRFSLLHRGLRRRCATTFLLSGAFSLLCQSAFATTSQAQQFVTYINAQRSSRAIQTMRVTSDLASYAYAHSRAMAAKQTIFHSTDAQLNSIPNWIGLGENVGMGDTVDDLNQAFMHSPEHRFNI